MSTPTATEAEALAPIVIPTLPPPPEQAAAPAAARPLLPEAFSFGRSVQGRDLVGRRIGAGNRVILLVGGIHGGWEANTIALVEAMAAHYSTTPGALLPGITLVLVPSLNPDGAALGQTRQGRFNANNVDLNRNWGCDWQPTAVFQTTPVDPGPAPFSEPETLAMAALINDLRPDAVLFYHSAANGVFGGACGGDVSSTLVRIVGQATGYNYGAGFSAYELNGTASDWVNSLGIPAAAVELISTNDIELARNLRGVDALQCWLIGPETAARLPACEGL